MTGRHDRAPWLKAWLQGIEVKGDVTADKNKRPYRLVLLGAPGVGKGTQAELIC